MNVPRDPSGGAATTGRAGRRRRDTRCLVNPSDHALDAAVAEGRLHADTAAVIQEFRAALSAGSDADVAAALRAMSPVDPADQDGPR
jgi:hypothetical protein